MSIDPMPALCRSTVLGDADLRWVLEYEIDRARRYKRPLALLRAVPHLLPRDYTTGGEVQAAAEVSRTHLRRIDHVAVLDDGSIVALLPETDEKAAASAARRLASELCATRGSKQYRTWLVGVTSLGEGFQSIETMLLAALADALKSDNPTASVSVV